MEVVRSAGMDSQQDGSLIYSQGSVMKNRLTKTFATYDTGSIEDYLALMCSNIEDAFLTNGATPGQDYSHLDLMKMAVQIATSAKNGPADDLSFVTGWPV